MRVPDLDWGFPLVLVATSVLCAFLALVLLHVWITRRQPRSAGLFDAPEDAAVFLFDDQRLVDATDPAHRLLDALPDGPSDWQRLSRYLAERFPDAPAQLADLASAGDVRIAARDDDTLTLEARWRDGLARIALLDHAAREGNVSLDRLSHRAMESELRSMRETMKLAPMPVWREEPDGTVTWANHAYLCLATESADRAGGEALTWPLPRLFDPPGVDDAGDGPAPADDEGPQRCCLDPAGDGSDAHWFDCYRRRCASGRIGFALPADALQRAETELRDFVQTLTRTFAHLPVGLAVFDRQRRLQVFNPALTDLTALGAGFLTGRPRLETFLHQLREAGMLPEPKDYKSWRSRILALEQAAVSGTYEETWSLPSGHTYRVTGRPHPDGAVAFFFEDISSEISLTRHFRAELETGQAVIDSMDEAIAVFSASGTLLMSNRAYAELWQVDPARAPAELGIEEAIDTWRRRAAGGADWEALVDVLRDGDLRARWTGRARLSDGGALDVQVKPLAGGAVLVTFAAADAPGTIDQTPDPDSGRAPARARSGRIVLTG